MGGEGSGRRADPVKKLLGFNQPAPAGEDAVMFMPNYSGIKDAARKTSEVDIEGGGGGGGAVDSVFGRTGAVVAVNNDYTVDLVDMSAGTEKWTTTGDISGANVLAGIISGASIFAGVVDVGVSGAKIFEDVTNLSGALLTHADDSTNPHGTVLTQNDVVMAGSMSGGVIAVTGDKTGASSGSATVVNSIYGTGATPPTASGTPIGTVYYQYTV